MNKYIIAILLVVCATVTSFAGTLSEMLTSPGEPAAEETKDTVEPISSEDVKPVPFQYIGNNDLKSNLHDFPLWMAQNINKAEGWSLTGYSWVGTDSQFRRYRWKVGLIGGELEYTRAIYDEHIYKLYEHENKEFRYTGLVGVSFMKEF